MAAKPKPGFAAIFIDLRKVRSMSSAVGTAHHSASNHIQHAYRRPVVADWRELIEGDSILLVGPGKATVEAAGTVDAITPDGELIWILQNGTGRRMYHRIDGYKALLEIPHEKP
jgi:hypothetical protein